MITTNIERFKVNRKVERDGRIWIPKLFSRILKLENENTLCITLEKDRLILQKGNRFSEENIDNFLVRYDGNGKLTIPKAVRESLGIINNSIIGVSLDVDKLYISKFTDSCIVCGTQKKLLINQKTVVCENCLEGFEIKSNTGGNQK